MLNTISFGIQVFLVCIFLFFLNTLPISEAFGEGSQILH